ncbi:MAG: hypothetical protein OEL68_05395, partial [Desulfobulbaceae bacterium]|nr:hypothetical protein [Desulfobulbaceae bacterium]
CAWTGPRLILCAYIAFLDHTGTTVILRRVDLPGPTQLAATDLQYVDVVHTVTTAKLATDVMAKSIK